VQVSLYWAPTRGGLVLATYVIAIRREVRSDATMAEEWVRQVPGVLVKAASNPSRIVIEASPQAIFEIECRFGDKVIVEPEIRHERLL
jgi:hypothetical protein